MAINMQFPQSSSQFLQRTHSTNIEDLALSTIGANRRYTQLEASTLGFNMTVCQLDGLILIREQLGAGMQIEAAPPENFIPFATMIHVPEAAKFCGHAIQKNTLLQATGGQWDLCFKDKIDYVGSILDKSVLAELTESLMGHEISPDWLINRALHVKPALLLHFGNTLLRLLSTEELNPFLQKNAYMRHFISREIMELVVKILTSTLTYEQRIAPQSRRDRGVNRVLDYLQSYAQHLPNLSELCQVAQLSERSLEYGFRERLGLTPNRYMQAIRLNAARKELCRATHHTKVTDVALAWGFSELGRFSKGYKQLFNELPSHTIQRVCQR